MSSENRCEACGKTTLIAPNAEGAIPVCADCGAELPVPSAPEAEAPKTSKAPPRKIKNAIALDPGRANKRRLARNLESGVKGGRNALLACAILFAALAPLWYYAATESVAQMEREVFRLEFYKASEAEIQVARDARDLVVTMRFLFTSLLGGLAAAFVAFFVWARKAPARACYAGLISYLVVVAGGGFFAPMLAFSTPGILMHVIVLVALITGLRSANLEKKIRAREAA